MGLVTLTINLESGMLVASKVGNLRSEFGPSGYRVIRYERDGRTDRRTDNSKAYCPFPTGGGITSDKVIYLPPTKEEVNAFAPVCLSVSVSVCLLARLLKNACMNLDEMFRVDRCRDMDELINF